MKSLLSTSISAVDSGLTPAMIAHEVRNYLDSLDAEIARLKESPGKREAKPPLHEVLESASRSIRSLVDAFSTGFSNVNPRLIDLTQVLWQQLAIIEPLAEELEVGLEIIMPDGPVHIVGDTRSLGRAILNLR
jgi:hypothetical protein